MSATNTLKLSDLDRWWRSISKFSATLFGMHEFYSLSSPGSQSDIHFLIFFISSGVLGSIIISLFARCALKLASFASSELELALLLLALSVSIFEFSS